MYTRDRLSVYFTGTNDLLYADLILCVCMRACVADVPMKPDKTWMSDGVDGVLTVRWKAPYDSGSPILQYLLLAWYGLSNCMI